MFIQKRNHHWQPPAERISARASNRPRPRIEGLGSNLLAWPLSTPCFSKGGFKASDAAASAIATIIAIAGLIPRVGLKSIISKSLCALALVGFLFGDVALAASNSIPWA